MPTAPDDDRTHHPRAITPRKGHPTPKRPGPVRRSSALNPNGARAAGSGAGANWVTAVTLSLPPLMFALGLANAYTMHHRIAPWWVALALGAAALRHSVLRDLGRYEVAPARWARVTAAVVTGLEVITLVLMALLLAMQLAGHWPS